MKLGGEILPSGIFHWLGAGALAVGGTGGGGGLYENDVGNTGAGGTMGTRLAGAGGITGGAEGADGTGGTWGRAAFGSGGGGLLAAGGGGGAGGSTIRETRPVMRLPTRKNSLIFGSRCLVYSCSIVVLIGRPASRAGRALWNKNLQPCSKNILTAFQKLKILLFSKVAFN